MTRQLVTHTQQAYMLSLNIITQDDTGLSFSVVPIVSFSGLVMLVWRIQRVKNTLRYKPHRIKQNTRHRLKIAGKLACIATTALVWGVM